MENSVATRIFGFDEVLGGGLPQGRPTLLRGGPGCGKTVFCVQFVGNGLAEDGEPAVYVTFDESPDAILGQFSAFGFESQRWMADSRLQLLDMRPPRAEQVLGQGYELDAVIARIEHALAKTGANRLVLDAIDGLVRRYTGPAGEAALWSVFEWVRSRQITALITCADRAGVTVASLEDYIADCVVHLSQRVETRLMTRLMRVAKCRGRSHGTNEFPFLIGEAGIAIMPVTSAELHAMSGSELLSTGLAPLDAMLGGGMRQGQAVLLSGRAGTGKTTMAYAITGALVEAGKSCLAISFEEAADNIVANLSVIGTVLQPLRAEGRLTMMSRSPVQCGLEEHLIQIVRLVDQQKPDVLLLDPISSLNETGNASAVKMTLLRLFDYVKSRNTSIIATELLPDGSDDRSTLNVSSLTDVWIRLRAIESNGEFNRLLYVAKARGAAASTQIKEFSFSKSGIIIEDPYIGPDAMVFGSAKVARQTLEDERRVARQARLDRLTLQLEEEQGRVELRRRILDQESAQTVAALREQLALLGAEINSDEQARRHLRAYRDRGGAS